MRQLVVALLFASLCPAQVVLFGGVNGMRGLGFESPRLLCGAATHIGRFELLGWWSNARKIGTGRGWHLWQESWVRFPVWRLETGVGALVRHTDTLWRKTSVYPSAYVAWRNIRLQVHGLDLNPRDLPRLELPARWPTNNYGHGFSVRYAVCSRLYLVTNLTVLRFRSPLDSPYQWGTAFWSAAGVRIK